MLHNDPGCHLQLSAHFNLHHAGDRRRAAPERDVGDVDLGHGLEQFNRDSPDELGSGANCSDFLDCLEVPTGPLPAKATPRRVSPTAGGPGGIRFPTSTGGPRT